MFLLAYFFQLLSALLQEFNPVMSKEDNKEGMEKFIITGNSGKVYYSSENTRNNRYDEGLLGTCECRRCFIRKPFEQVRWDSLLELFICFDCIEKEEQSRK